MSNKRKLRATLADGSPNPHATRAARAAPDLAPAHAAAWPQRGRASRDHRGGPAQRKHGQSYTGN